MLAAPPAPIETGSHSLPRTVLLAMLGRGSLRRRRQRSGVLGAATLKVVATTTVFADIIRNVGGDRVAVTSIIPAGVGPEDYEPKPDDAKKLAGADLIVSNGVGLDDFLDKLIRRRARARRNGWCSATGSRRSRSTASRTRISGSTRASWPTTTCRRSPRR